MMPICALPIFRIYEDFDKISAKEVAFTESGDKVTIKLLHFPNLSLDEQEKIQNTMSDSGDETIMSDEDKKSTSSSSGTTTVGSTPGGIGSGNASSDEKPQRHRKKSSSSSRKLSDSMQRKLSGGAEKFSNSSPESSQKPHHPQHNQQHYHHHNHHAPYHYNHLHRDRNHLDPHPATSTPVRGSIALRKQLLARRSPSPNNNASLCPGYEQYQMSLLEVPMPRDYGDASSDDLSSEWDSDVAETTTNKGTKVNTHITSNYQNLLEYFHCAHTYLFHSH